MKEQVKNLELASFDPAQSFEDEVLGTDSVLKRKKELAEIARDDSLHLEIIRECLGRQRHQRYRQLFEKAREDRSLGLDAISKARQHSPSSHDHGLHAREKKNEIMHDNALKATRARYSSDVYMHAHKQDIFNRDQYISSLYSRIQREQIRKDKVIDKRAIDAERKRRINRDKVSMREARRERQLADEQSVRMGRIERMVREQRRLRNKEARKFSMHFARQQNQISKQMRLGKLEWTSRNKQEQASKRVQQIRYQGAKKREIVQDAILSEFNKRRHDAIVQQMEIRDTVQKQRAIREQKVFRDTN